MRERIYCPFRANKSVFSKQFESNGSIRTLLPSHFQIERIEMSGRGPVGASNRADLFTSRSDAQSTGRESKNDEYDHKHDDVDDQNPLQLEHMLGYAGDYHKTILASPHDENVFMKR